MTAQCHPALGSTTGTLPISLGDAAAALRELSQPWEMGDKIKSAIGRAARQSGLAYWRTFDLWYGKARRIEDFEREMIAKAIEDKRDAELQKELHDLRLRLARLESLLVQKDPAFDRPASRSRRAMDGEGGIQNRPVASLITTKIFPQR